MPDEHENNGNAVPEHYPSQELPVMPEQQPADTYGPEQGQQVASATSEQPGATPYSPVEPATVTPDADQNALTQPADPSPFFTAGPPVAPIASQPTAAHDFANAPKPKRGRKGLLVGLIVAVALVVLGGASASAYVFWYQNPDKVVSDGIVNAITAQSVAATGNASVETDDYTMKLEVAGAQSSAGDSTLSVKLDITSDVLNYQIDGEGIFSANGDLYVKVNNVEELTKSLEEQSDGMLSFEAFSAVIKKIDGNWIKITKEDLGDFSEDYAKTQQCFADVSKSLESDAGFRRTVENETKDLYKANQFIIVGDKIGSRDIKGTGSLGYALTADRDKADAFFTAFADTQLGKKFAECNNDIKFADIVPESQKEYDGVTIDAEVWVARFGHDITEFNMKISDDEAKGNLVVNPVFNKTQAVTLPTDTISLAELKADIEKIYSDYASGSSQVTPVDGDTNPVIVN